MKLMSGNLTNNGALVHSLEIINKSLMIFASFLVIGVLVSLAFLIRDKEGAVKNSDLQRVGFLASLVWTVTSALHIALTLANILGTSLAGAFEPTSLKSFISQIDLGKFLLVQTLLALFITVGIRVLSTTLQSAVFLFIALAALVAPVFQSHTASSGSHSLAVGSLVVHVIALSLWVGGLFAIALIPEEDRTFALPRFSSLALWAAIAVVVSGVVNAWVRLNFADAWSTSYARIVIAKTLLTVLLLVFGYRNRAELTRRDFINWSSLARLISVEVFVMAAVVVLGSWLSVTQPPSGREAPFSPALSIVGLATPQKPSLTRILLSYNPDALVIAVLILLVALYIKGVAVLKKRGDSWPVGRTISFACAIAFLDFATSGGLGVYALFSFEYHMIAHMVIGMIAPIFMVMSAPITLALRTLPQGRVADERGMRGTLIAFLHSKYAVLVTNPLTALALFDGSLFVLYFTNLFGDLMQNHAGHLFMNIHFFLAGFLFFHIIIGIDPNPRKIPHLVRIVVLFAAMSIHAFFSIALIASTSLIDQGYYGSLKTPWLGDLLADQQAGGSVGWAMGEVPIIIALIATFIQWMRDDSREAKRIDRNEARMAAMGEPDELAQYNMYLNKLQSHDEKEGLS